MIRIRWLPSRPSPRSKRKLWVFPVQRVWLRPKQNPNWLWNAAKRTKKAKSKTCPDSKLPDQNRGVFVWLARMNVSTGNDREYWTIGRGQFTSSHAHNFF